MRYHVDRSILGVAVTHRGRKVLFLDPQAPEGKFINCLASNWSADGSCVAAFECMSETPAPALEGSRAQTDEVRTDPMRSWKLQKRNFPTSSG